MPTVARRLMPITIVVLLTCVDTPATRLFCTESRGDEATPPRSAGDSRPGPELTEQEHVCLANLQQVTSDFAKAGEGYFSPDGREIVFQAVPYDYPFYRIYEQTLAPLTAATHDTPRARLVSTGRGRTTCAYFSPDARDILFASSHLDPQLEATEAGARRQQEEDRRSGRRRRYQWDFDPHMDLFVLDRDRGTLQQLTDSPGYDAECAYSPDGSRIAFCSDRDGDPDIYIMDADGTQVRQLTNADGYDGGPFISPNGKWIVYRTDRLKKDYLQLHVLDIDGRFDVPLTDNDGVNWGPYWHPTQPYIIWAGADHSVPGVRPNYDLWIMRYEVVEGQPRKVDQWRITDHPAADVLPVFSPDGKKLMWTSNRTEDGTSQLWIADFAIERLGQSQ